MTYQAPKAALPRTFEEWLYLDQTEFYADDLNKREIELARAAYVAASTPPAPAEPQGEDPDSTPKESYRRMFHAAAADLGRVSEALGLYMDDAGADPILDAIEALRAAPPPQQPAPTCDVWHAHFTPFYLLANCRRIAAAKYRSKPNWVIAMELFALGSNSARKVCQDAGIDPDAPQVRPAAMSAAQGDAAQGGKRG